MSAYLSRIFIRILLPLLLLLGASSVQAGLFCSEAPFFGVVDGNERAELGGSYAGTAADPWITQITIDTDCTFVNFPASDPLTTTLNFQTNDPSIYLITFDGVTFTGNMACANIDHRIWFVNGSDYGSNNNCQDLFIPVEAINKQNPVGVTTVGIGDPFTYTLNIPVLYDPATSTFLNNFGSANDLHSITIVDDLNATGADLTVVGTPTVTWFSGPNAGLPVPHTYSNVGGVLTFEIDPTSNPGVIIPAGDQLQIAITVVADNTNAIGTQFTNTATWSFGRLINIDLDGDGIPEPNFFDPLPGENGVTDPLTIGGPDLVLTKTNPDTAINITSITTYTLDVQNVGSTDAWNANILDFLPYSGPGASDMCEDQTPNFTAEIFEADGITSVSGPLVLGTDYSVNVTGAPACEYEFTMQSSNAVIGPSEHLIITYEARLDNDTTPADDATVYTNYAGVTEWYSGDPAGGNPVITYTQPDPATGSPGTLDHEDSHSVTATLTGYIFQKTVENVESGTYPATNAFPGDTLRYTLRLFNFTEVINGLTITDTLDPALFDLASFNMITPLPDGVADYSFNGTTGELQIFGAGGANLDLDPAVNPELVIEFEIDLDASLANGAAVPNQANALASAGAIDTDSDDPYVGGVFDPINDPPALPDATVVTVQGPGALSKTNPAQTSYTIGETFTYTITVPDVAVGVPLYDVRILDNLTAYGADLAFVSATDISGHGWTLSNTGTSSNIIIEDTGTGIDIPANEQAIIEVTVQVQNTLANQQGNSFNNRAFYTYNRVNGDVGSQSSGVTDPATDTTPNMTLVEPNISAITKTADNTTPTAGETVRYSIDITADSGANFSDVFDVQLVDTLDLGLVYAGNPTVTVGGGVSADNTIGAPDITGDGINTAQTLEWNVGNADIDIVAGDTVTIEYDVQVLDSVLANQALNNSVVAQWSSVDGPVSGERTGIDGVGGLNDYTTATVVETVTINDIVATINKVRSDDTFVGGDDNVRIGDIVEYTITLSIPEGTLGNLQLGDTLPQGLDFEGVVSINGITTAPYTAVAPFSHADIAAASIFEAGDPATGPTTVTWSLGDVNNQPIDDTPNDFVIVYRARVMDGILAQANNTPLNNTVAMSYDTATATINQSDIDTVITVLQPDLVVSKSASPAGGDVIIDANEIITYTVNVVNNGTAPAYDIVVEDVIPAGLRNGAATITMVSTTLAGVPVADVAPTYTAATGLAIWDFDTGVADAYTLGSGETLTIVYQVQADAAIGQGLVLINAAQVNNYYSFDDEDVPTLGTVSGTREIYGPSNTASTALYTGAPPTKALISPAPASPEAAIGEEVIYQITLPGTVSASTLYDLQVTDTLDANLEFVSANVVGGIGITDTSVATQMNIAIDEIPAGTQAVIELRARVRNVLGAQQGVDINNTVSYTYAFVDGGAIQPALVSTDIVTINIVEPNIGAITKTADNLTPTADEVVRYSVVLAADGGADNSDVFDVTITDTLDLGLVYEGNPAVTVGGGVSADNTIGAPVITGDGVTTPQTLVWSLANGNADIDIIEGTPVTIEYDVRVLSSVLAGQVLNNTVVAEWTGIDGINIYERDGSDGIGNLNDYITAPAIETLNTPNINITINKIRSNDTYGAGDDDVRIGDIVEYTLTLSVPEGAVANLQVIDTLPQGLDFEGIASINGDTVAPYSSVAPFIHTDIAAADVTEVGDPATGPTTVTWDLGDLTNQPIDDTNNDFVIVYYARVLDNVFAQANSTPLNNTVNVSYDTATGTIVNSDIDTVVNILQPDLVVSKSATAAGGDAEIVANELVTYTVSVVNNGTAPAYDLVLEDIIPVGLRNGTATITMVSTTLAGAPVANVTPTYDPVSGLAVWDFNTPGVANTYTINAGETLSVVYQVQADADLGAGLTVINAATGTNYYSFDDEGVPTLGGTNGIREIYGPTNTATSTLTSPTAGALDKANPADTTVTIGETFTYLITVPATPVPVALHDVRILDDISFAATGADLSFVSVAISGAQTWVPAWTPANTGTPTSLVIEDPVTGIDIPAGEQAIIEVTLQVDDTANNFDAVQFQNTADYTFNQYNDTPATQQNGLPDTTGFMTIVEPDQLNVLKTGPPTIRVGLPGTYTLDIHNTGTSPAYDVTIEDVLPNLVNGGMCDTTPYNVTAQIYDGGGAAVGGPLVLNTDFTMSFVFGSPTCDLSFTMVTPAAAIPADHHLIITYDVRLDNDSANNVSLTNIAGATEWFSQDTTGAGATGETRTYTRTLNDAVTAAAALDHEDAYTTVTESPTIQFRKYVVNTTTGQDPGTDASPGDVLHYRIEAVNVSPVDVPVFSIIDELDALNVPPVFVAGSLQNLTVNGSTYTDNSDANGGTNGTGLVNVSDLSMSAAGGGSDTINIEFDITLTDVINSGTLVLNQAQLQIYNLPPVPSDDPNVNGLDDPFTLGDEDPTQTLIASASQFQVLKTSDDISGSATDLLPGDTLRYTITVKNIGNENAVNATLQDNIPADTTYVSNSTTLNGNSVADVAGNSPLQAGMLINAPLPEDPTPGVMRADADPLATNVATITFDVTINDDAVEGAIISNQAQLTADGAGTSGAVAQSSDDPDVNGIDDPTVAGDEDPTVDIISRPNGAIYDSISRQALPGVTVRLLRASDGGRVPEACFSDPAQQDQVTTSTGYYKFNLENFNAVDCPDGADYLVSIIDAPQGYDINYWPSRFIPPTSDATTAAYDVIGCPADAVGAPAGRCEARTTGTIPTGTVATPYYLHMTFGSNVVDNMTVPPTTTDVNNQIFNNHIPLDSEIAAAISITKTTPLVNVTRGELVPYTITLRNTLGGVLQNMTMFDQLPPGFKYVEGSGRFNGNPREPIVSTNGRQLQWNNLDIVFNETYTFQLLLVVSSGVSEGEYVNQAWAQDSITGGVSDIAAATVRVVPDPAMDCSDVIGKVYDDRNLNGYQDEGEPGIGGVRVATARGLLVTTDKHGRFHVTCAVVPDEDRGSNFILKVDERTLPTGYRITTENPRVQRVTRGKMARYNFGATVHHVVTLSVADGVFQSGTDEIRPQWTPRLGLLMEELRKQVSVLRITYLADVESKGLVDDRMAVLKSSIRDRWEEVSDKELEIEAEVFWRHGGPVSKGLNIFSSNDVEDYVSSIFDRDNFGEDTERQLPHGYTYTPWMQDPALFEKDDEPKFEIKQVAEKKFTTRKLTGLVPPILFRSGKADISEEFVIKLRDILNSMRDRTNVRLHFIGHTDNVQLRGELKRRYEDNLGLSKERAGTTAEFFQRALELPPESISYEGMGETSPVASNDTEAGRGQNRRVEVQVWYDEVDEELVDRRVEIDEEIKRVMVCRVETVCKLRYKEGHSRRAKLKNLVPPFHYDEGVSEIPAQYLQQLRQALQNLSSKDNVQMRFIAYTDNIPLTGRDARIYGDHVGLSKANARRVAIAVQEALGLPNAAIASTGRGSTNPVASNNSEKGRALNRRIEVEFWHDDPLEDLPDEPQICPEASAAETVERIYNPPEGDIQPIYFENGQAVIPDGYTRALQRAMDDIQDKGNVRLRFIGYTSNKRLSRRTAMVYGDDIGLSTARARRAMEAIKESMGLTESQAEFEGRGYVQSHDVVNTGFVELDRSKVEVQVVYDELAVLDEQEGVSIKRLVRDVSTKNPFALNLMRISVDGQPINDPNKNIPDVQRCTDVALDKAQVRFKFDNLNSKPRLNVTAWPNVISQYDGADTEFVENLTHFKLYSNYPWAIDKAEVRVFKAEQSTRDTPLAVIPVNEQGRAQWQFNLEDYSAPRMQLKYLLRAYDKQGHFDETIEQTLWVVDELETDNSETSTEKALLVGYGENRLGLNNIPLHVGTVRVYGEQVPEGHKVWFAGYELPVSEEGKFGGEYIIPSGLHTVEVSITDENGNGHVYQRDLELENSDWFYVGIADVTVGIDDTNGPADIVTGDEDHYNDEVFLDGRLAFYAKGKFASEATLTASADTREGPVEDLFSNFMNKNPEALFRRMDPDKFYPTFGDDSTVEEDAPTSGKFYVKYQKDKNYGLWGNFDIAYTDNNLAHVDRGLYGANVNYESGDATTFGENRYSVNLFAAEPGTVAGRDEFLGTGGSLYYLRHQDILPGSERIRIETRDAVSGMVTGVKNLTAGLDYEIDYIQGRIMLAEPVSASAVSDSLVDSSDFGGTDVMVVARYEYTPGFDDLDEVITGGRAHYWFNDQVKLGITAEDHGDAVEATSLKAFDLTWRKNAGTWLRIESSTSQGPVSSTLSSSDGGYSFTESALLPGTDVTAKGQRVDASVRLEDVFDGVKGTFTLYNQQLDAGYAAPGLIAQTDTTQTGASLTMPVNEQVSFKLKTDQQDRDNGLETSATELDGDYLFDDNWTFSAGVRSDSRTDNSASVPITQKEGDRTDMALRATFDSKENWLSYGYVQGTTSTSGNREDNGRLGVGGDYRFTDRFKLGGELSSGDLGEAIRMATQYKMTDTTDLYSSYALENERTDNGVKARQGNFVSGFKSRYSDSASIYMEERYTHGDVPTGLTHSMGFDLAINDALNFGANVDVGTLTDNNTGAETSRTGAGIRVGYKLDSLTFASALEYRVDETEQADESTVERKTWLSKSNLKYKLSDDWRLLAKLNLSESESSLGDFYNGSFTEAILGYAYRPVSEDALNALFKYTYFYNLPSAGQVSSSDTSSQYIQKSQVVSLDASYDITKRWTLGGKYAYRFGELSIDREDPEFFESNAALSIIRVDWHFTHRWDALVEARKLELPQAKDSRSGALFAIYRHFGNHIKLGAGYNFTDFSDDLTDLDYDSQGLFINAIGKF